VYLHVCTKAEFCKRITDAISGHQLITSEVYVNSMKLISLCEVFVFVMFHHIAMTDADTVSQLD